MVAFTCHAEQREERKREGERGRQEKIRSIGKTAQRLQDVLLHLSC